MISASRGVRYGHGAGPSGGVVPLFPHGQAHCCPLRAQSTGPGTAAVRSAPQEGHRGAAAPSASSFVTNANAPQEGHAIARDLGGLHFPHIGLHAQHIAAPSSPPRQAPSGDGACRAAHRYFCSASSASPPRAPTTSFGRNAAQIAMMSMRPM